MSNKKASPKSHGTTNIGIQFDPANIPDLPPVPTPPPPPLQTAATTRNNQGWTTKKATTISGHAGPKLGTQKMSAKKNSSSQDKNASLGSKDTEAYDDEEKPKKKKSSSQDKNSSFGSKDTGGRR
jgi:hypothetical protein